ncbi:MAG: hypothetical protein QW175_07025 [Candidatus Bathyarchaeia archaeon]
MAEANLGELRGKAIELQSRVWDLERRTANLESLLGTLISPFSYRLGSRWVLEIFPEEIEDWIRAVRTIPVEPLTERERSFLRNLEYYIMTERKITLPQLFWLASIQRKAGGAMPKIPIPPAETSHSSSNPYAKCPKCGYAWSPPPSYCPRCLTIV